VSPFEEDEEEAPVLEDTQVNPSMQMMTNMGSFLGCDGAPEIEATEVHAGAVALLICDIAGGHIPKDLCEQRGLVDVKIHTDAAVRAGKAKVTQRCAELETLASATVSEKGSRAIARLADQGLKADEIAHALDEDEMEVHRIIRRRGWNMNVPQKLCIFLHRNDLEGAKYIDISLHLKKKRIAKGSMPIRHVLSHFHMKHSEIVKCLSESKGMCVDLDAEFRIYSLGPAGGKAESLEEIREQEEIADSRDCYTGKAPRHGAATGLPPSVQLEVRGETTADTI
jgi:hypothetical protein